MDDLVEHFRAALMRAHADDWDMETVSEAAHVCAASMKVATYTDGVPVLLNGERVYTTPNGRSTVARVPSGDAGASSVTAEQVGQ